MEPILESTAEEVDHDAQEETLVRAWRTEQLRRLGLPHILSEAFADSVDWHALAKLVDRGCPPMLALEIIR